MIDKAMNVACKESKQSEGGQRRHPQRLFQYVPSRILRLGNEMAALDNDDPRVPRAAPPTSVCDACCRAIYGSGTAAQMNRLLGARNFRTISINTQMPTMIWNPHRTRQTNTAAALLSHRFGHVLRTQ